MIQHKQLDWWVNKLKKNEYFSLARFGDGEFLCLQGRQGANSHGCKYTPELRSDLVSVMEYKDTNFYKGMQRITPLQFSQIRPLLEGEWFDTEVFGDEMALGNFGSFFHSLKAYNVVIVSSAVKRKVSDTLPFMYSHFIETPHTNAHLEKDRIIAECLAYKPVDIRPVVFLFACGMAAGTFVHALHGRMPITFLIDIGHVFDPFIGDNSREYLKHVPKKTLMKNLYDQTE